MTISKIELVSFLPAISNSGETVYTKVHNVYFTGTWDAMAIGMADVAVGGVTLHGVGSLLEGTGTGGLFGYYANNITPDLQEGSNFATIRTVYRGGGQYEALFGLRDTVTWEDVDQNKQIFFDYNGLPIVNRANQVFAQNPATPGTLRACTITGVRSTPKLKPISDWKIVNSAAITIAGETFSAGQAWMTNSRAEETLVQGVRKYMHTWQLLFRSTHDLEVPNMGTTQLIDADWDDETDVISGGTRMPIKMGGKIYTQPWPLDAFGKALPEGFATTDVQKLTFDITEDYDFSNFGWSF